MHIAICGPAEPNQIFLDVPKGELPLGWGGIPVNLLARALADAGIKVSLISTSPHISKPWSMTRDNMSVFLVPMRSRVRDYALDCFKRERRAIADLLTKIDPDVIHAHWTYEFALAALSTKKPVLVTAHDAPLVILKYLPDPYRLIRAAMAYIVRLKTKNLTAVSPYLARKWRIEMFWRKALPVIPNISPFLISGNSRQENSVPIVLSIGDAANLKNLATLLMAWPLIKERVPLAQLHVVGHGLAVDEELAKWARKKEVDSGVTWHGYLERGPLEKLLAATDVLVHPSLEEAQPMVLLEAMSKGVPIVGGVNSGGVPWTIGDAGILVNVKSPRKIADATVKLLLNDLLRKDLGKRGQDRIRLEFSPERVAGLYVEQYERLLKIQR